MSVLESSVNAKDSLYAPSLESIAPNITTLIDAVKTPGESWADALTRSMPFMTLTANQKTQLSGVLDRVFTGLPPLVIPTPTQQLQTLVLWVSVGLAVWRFIKM